MHLRILGNLKWFSQTPYVSVSASCGNATCNGHGSCRAFDESIRYCECDKGYQGRGCEELVGGNTYFVVPGTFPLLFRSSDLQVMRKNEINSGLYVSCLYLFMPFIKKSLRSFQVSRTPVSLLPASMMDCACAEPRASVACARRSSVEETAIRFLKHSKLLKPMYLSFVFVLRNMHGKLNSLSLKFYSDCLMPLTNDKYYIASHSVGWKIHEYCEMTKKNKKNKLIQENFLCG